MVNTRLMDRLFSATDEKDEELTGQVAQDIEDAKANGSVDTEELKYEDAGDGKVAITDKGNGEVTIAEKAEDGNYDLYPAQQSDQIEGFIHPERDGVTPGHQKGAPDENVEDHFDEGSVIAPNQPDGGLNPEAGHEKSVEDEDEEKEFSVYSDNVIVQRIFTDQEFCERVFSEVIESEETAKIGELKVEKSEDEENTVIVTNETTGDQAKVTLDDDEMEVTELDSKNFSDEEEDGEYEDDSYDALHVVGVDSFNHVIVDAPEYDEESAQELVERLTEQGVDAVQIFDNAEDARDYAAQLLEGLDATDTDEPTEATFSDIDGYEHDCVALKFYSDNTDFMIRLFSEAVNDIDASQSTIEDAIENGDEIETDTEVITPIDSSTAVVEDKENGEFTKVTLDGDEMELDSITSEEAEELTDHIEVEDKDDDEDEEDDEKEFSDIWCDETETKFFSEHEYLTEYMVRLFSGDADEEAIEDAIENGDQIENETEVITPIDSTTAVVEDKENGEFTKAVMDDDKLELEPISEEEADELTEHLEVEDTDKDEDEEDDEKEFSYYNDPILDKFFADAVGPQLQAQAQPAGQAPIQQVQAQPIQEQQTVEEPAPSVEAIEDKAIAAVQSIQAAAAEAEATIMNAKAAPVENQEAELQEAQFSDRMFSNTEDTLVSWLNGTKFGK